MWPACLCVVTVTSAAFALAAAASDGGSLGRAKKITDFPMEVRRRNALRISRQACDECVTLEDFYKAHPLTFILFFERALMSTHRYKAAIVSGFHEVCAELRWSRVTCGIVDMLDDRDYAQRYIDPKHAPAHIVVRDGTPIPSSRKQVKQLLDKPGDKDTMLEHVRELLAPEEAPDVLSISSEVSSAEAFARLLKDHDIVVAGAVGDSRAAADAFGAAAQRLVLNGELPGEVPPGLGKPAEPATPPKKGVRRWRRARRRRRLAFAALSGSKAVAAHGLAEGVVAVFASGRRVERPGEAKVPSWSESTATEALLAAVRPALHALEPSAGQPAEAPSSPPRDGGAAGPRRR
eukprot:CAMPEP_0171248888 /NCGR_PEP_ID=MMETSP0790-20130122/49255_1 /TAXON_ID=2925 /ORGANISM="Alexandrium catenella, Strain OF101" /LENGTH=348 /DNA_ID=CAMNT_0011716367 /DNA_START=1 /DNA_END=1044 /DNA_ORIENTATION=-